MDRRTLAPFPLGWSPPSEHQFQTYMAFDPSVRAWRNDFQSKFGESPDMSRDSGFDYRAAYAAGDGPRPYAGDIPHWGSAGKLPGHQTEWKQHFMTQFGVDPDTPGLQYSPQMQSFMTKHLSSVPFALAPPPWGGR